MTERYTRYGWTIEDMTRGPLGGILLSPLALGVVLALFFDSPSGLTGGDKDRSDYGARGARVSVVTTTLTGFCRRWRRGMRPMVQRVKGTPSAPVVLGFLVRGRSGQGSPVGPAMGWAPWSMNAGGSWTPWRT